MGCLFFISLGCILLGIGLFSVNPLMAIIILLLGSVGMTSIVLNIVHMRRQSKARKTQLQAIRDSLQLEAEPVKGGFSFAEYISGLAGYEGGGQSCTYLVSSDEYVFLDMDHNIMCHVRRDSISNTETLPETAFTKKIEMGALMVLGPLGLGAQSTDRHDTYYFVLHYKDLEGIEHQAIFRNSRVDEFNTFNSYRHQYVERLSTSEKKCPHCAEIIKSEATKCRFCGSDLDH